MDEKDDVPFKLDVSTASASLSAIEWPGFGNTSGLLPGLLSDFTPVAPETSAQREFRAQLIRSRIQCRRIQASKSLFGGAFEIGELDFEEKVLDFALKRGLSLEGDWKRSVLECAAREHPDLQTNKRGRGRPKRETGRGLLQSFAGPTPEDREALLAYDKLARLLRRRSLKVTQTSICKLYFALRDPGFDPNSEVGKANIKHLARRFAEARKRVGAAPLARGRPKSRNFAK